MAVRRALRLLAVGSGRVMAAAVVLLGGLACANEASTAPGSARTAFVKAHCFECHADAADDKGGGVRLDGLSADIGVDLATAETWQKVLKAVNAGEMPPEEKPRPQPAALEAFLESLSVDLVTARRKLADAGTATTLRRLNRREYAATIRDLVGVDGDVSNLPDDAAGGGYDTAGPALVISSDQFEAYLATARQAVAERIGRRTASASSGPPKRLERDRSSVDLIRALKVGEQSHDRGLTSLGDAGIRDTTDYQFVNAGWSAFVRYGYLHFLRHTVDGLRQPKSDDLAYLSIKVTRAGETIQIPKDWPQGRYVVRVRCAANPDVPRNRRFLEIGQLISELQEFRILGCHEVLGTPDDPRVVEQEVVITKAGSRDIVLRERRHSPYSHEGALYYDALAATGTGRSFSVGIDDVVVEGPLPDAVLGDASLDSLFPADGSAVDDGVARELLAAFATRAFRGRVPPASFLDKLVAIRRLQSEQGATPAEAMIEPVAVILASPAFLYLVEPAGPSASPRPLTDRELATRLSYFLTGGPPDAELLAAAATGGVAAPDTLIRQADRLIAGERAPDFVRGFVYQWLDLERLEFFQFDPVKFWDFDDSTREAARQEVYRFFTRVLRENMSTKEFLDSDWTVVDGLLGSYYGIAGVQGPEWRVVSLPPDAHRGGLMGMAAVLAMGSNGIRTSPVERGAWVLRKLVDQPPPPAPANVPQLSRLEGELVSTRERLKMHQDSPQCVHCHKKIDPIGFGMDNFDAGGRWRIEESHTAKGKGTQAWPIDPAGTFVDGRAFGNYDELKSLVTSRHEAFARSLTANLLEYALGRPLGLADDPLVDAIHAATKPNGHRLRDIVHEIVRSEAFRTK